MYIYQNLSQYAQIGFDGGEILSEVLSDIYNNDNPSEFSLKFKKEFDIMRMKRRTSI